MIKMIALIRRKDGTTHEEFKKYYEENHAPLALSLFPQFKKYRRNFTVGDRIRSPQSVGSGVPYDVVTEISFADRASFDAMMTLVANPAIGKKIAEDEAKFMDISSIQIFLAEERESNIPN